MSDLRAVATEYMDGLNKLLADIDLEQVHRVVEHLRAVRDRQGTVYVAGNGGSAATATHWVNDLCKATKVSKQCAIRAMSLSDNSSWLTALANDEGYERVFAGQLENFAQQGDALVVISASGNSKNLIEAVRMAKEKSVLTIGLLGFDGGLLKEEVDDFVWVASEIGAYGLVETGHTVVSDVITTCLMNDLAEGA